MATQVTMWETAGGQLYRTRQEAVDAEDKEGLLKAFQDFGATSVIATDKAAVLLTDPASGFPYRAVLTVKEVEK